MKKSRNIVAVLASVLILFTALLPFQALAAADGLSVSVSYEAKCGEPSVFTVNADGGSGNYFYYLGNITRDGEDGQYYVVDPTRLPAYKTDNTFQFTFCASGVYYLHFYVMDKGVSPIATKREIVKVVLNDPEYPSIESIADDVAAQCLANCQTEYDKALWLHDWLLDHCEYDYSYNYCGPEGALARGTGTCEAYHRAYTMLLNRIGIANGRVTGNGHVWTAVRMDGNWYQVDVTWDDNGYSNHTYENYLYFGLNDTIMSMVHSDHISNSSYLSDSLENNYLIRSGEIHQWSDSLEESIQKNLNSGNTTFEIPIESSMPMAYQNVIYSIAAYQLSSQKWTTETHTVKLDAFYSTGQIKFVAEYIPIGSSEPDVPLNIPAVENLKISDLSTKGATLSFDKVTDASGYEIQYLLNDKWTTVCEVTNNSKIFSQLASNRFYIMRVRAYVTINGVKTYSDNWSSLVAFTTYTTTNRMTFSNLSTTGATVTLKAVTYAGAYEIQSLVNGKWVTMCEVANSINTFSKLIENKLYTMRFRAFKTVDGAKVYSSNWSAAYSFTTYSTAARITFSNIHSKGATLNINSIRNADGYELQYVSNGLWVKFGDLTKNSRIFSSLESGKKYTFRIRAYTVINGQKIYSSNMSGAYSFTTLAK